MDNDNMMEIMLGKFVLTVDEDTGHKILNDDVYAQQYLQQLTEIEESSNPNSDDQTNTSTSSVSANIPKFQEKDLISKPNKNKIWTTSRIQTETDKAATIYFLALRKKLNSKFADKCTAKNSLWLEIAKNMNEAGFFVGEGIEGREKCRQKFVNLQSCYMKYIDKKRSTGEGKIEKPPFYEEINEILGEKDKVHPTYLIDSLENKTTLKDCSNTLAVSKEERKNTSSTSKSATFPESAMYSPHNTATTSKSVNRFKNCNKTVTPKRNEILENFYNLAERSEQRQKTEFQTMVELIKDDSQKRHEQVMSLISALNKTNQRKKRKRDSSESD